MREASSITLITELVKMGAKIKAYDPKAIAEAKHYLKDILDSVLFVDSKYEALKNADAMFLVTEWKEFRSPDFDEVAKLLQNKIIFDGRNQYNGEKLKELGFEYSQIGVKN